MLEGIETGNEERYDFPLREGPPPATYLLATVPRTGSSFVGHLLWRSRGCLGAPLEYLNFRLDRPARFAVNDNRRSRPRFGDRCCICEHHRNGVFGLKCFPAQLRAIQQSNPAMLTEVMMYLLCCGTRSRRPPPPSRSPCPLDFLRAGDPQASGDRSRRAARHCGYAAGAIDHARQLLERAASGMRHLGIRDRTARPWYEESLQQPEQAITPLPTSSGSTLTGRRCRFTRSNGRRRMTRGNGVNDTKRERS